ncbi:MAG: hypothetical protein FWG07_05820 [Treponema sp.]|nr:hypothetical protein [Treponema sp.]
MMYCQILRFTKIVTVTGVLMPEPKIFPPSFRDNSPEVLQIPAACREKPH